MLYAIPVFAILVGLFLGFCAIRGGRSDIAIGFAGLLSALIVVTLWKEHSTPGIDALIFTATWVFVLVPSAIALCTGAALGYLGTRPMARSITG